MGGILISLNRNLSYTLFLSLIKIIPFIIWFKVFKFGYDNKESNEITQISKEFIPQEIIN